MNKPLTEMPTPNVPPRDQAELLAALQARFALINMDGKLWLLDLTCLSATSDDGAMRKLAFSNRSDGTLLLQRYARHIAPQIDIAGVMGKFFVSPATRCYDGVEFNPKPGPSNLLNLWRGPTVIAVSGSWTRIELFLREVICGGDERSYNYLIRFIAHALQRPWEKPGVLVVLLSGQGTGKGTFGRILQLIWSATYLQVHDINSVIGNFNAALERAFIVFMDEAIFAGDRRASDALKSLVTEPVIFINEKHQPARQIRSYHRYIAATNADHLKNTDRDDRRDFVLRVSEERKGDFAYWKELNQEIDNGGVAAMVHDMLAMGMSDFNVRDKPGTQELIEQKLLSLAPIPRWWYDVLYRGDMGGDEDWPDFIGTESIIKGVLEVAGRKLYRNPSAIEVVQAMAKMCPSARKAQRQNQLNRQRGLTVPPLSAARAEFDQYIGGQVIWDADTTDLPTTPDGDEVSF